MTYRKFTELLSKSCSKEEYAENITGHIMDTEDCFDWEAEIPEKYISVHLPWLKKGE